MNGTSVIDYAQGILQPLIVDQLVWIVGGILTFVFGLLPFSKEAKARAEANMREGLHSALDTAVGLIIDTAQAQPSIAVYDRAVGEALSYVYRSVPDAIKKLGPSPQHLEEMLRSKLQVKLNELLGRDPMTEALIRAGLDAVKPQAGLSPSDAAGSGPTT